MRIVWLWILFVLRLCSVLSAFVSGYCWVCSVILLVCVSIMSLVRLV